MREKGDRGFTLVELLLALAVGGVILTGAVLSIYSVLVTTGRSNSQVIALTDINQAALAIRNDLMMAQTTDLVDGVLQNSANLTWIDYTTSFGGSSWTSHSSAYTLSGKELRRTYDDTVGIVGRNVTSISFTQFTESIEDRNRVTVTVAIATSNTTLPSGTETIRFSVHLRPEEIQ